MGLIRFEPVRTGSSRGYSGFAFFLFFLCSQYPPSRVCFFLIFFCVPSTPLESMFFFYFFCSVGGLEDRGVLLSVFLFFFVPLGGWKIVEYFLAFFYFTLFHFFYIFYIFRFFHFFTFLQFSDFLVVGGLGESGLPPPPHFYIFTIFPRSPR